MSKAEPGAFRVAIGQSYRRANRFFVAVVLVGLLVAILSGWQAAPTGVSAWVRVWYGVVTFIAAILLTLAGTFLYSWVRAPYEQRDEARAEAAALRVENKRLKTPPPAPALRLDNRLEADTAARCFRLRVYNDNATPAQPSAELVKIVDKDNRPLVDPTQLPIELAWTHRDWDRPTLSSQNAAGETVAVLCLNEPANSAEAEFYVYWRGARPSIGRVNQRLRGTYIYASVRVRSPEHPTVAPAERTYVLRWNEEAVLRFVP